jgi:hypothetical protein
MGWATFWAIFVRTHPVTLFTSITSSLSLTIWCKYFREAWQMAKTAIVNTALSSHLCSVQFITETVL